VIKEAQRTQEQMSTSHESESGDNTEGGKRPRVWSLTINSKSTLYAAYISFFKNGGFFMPTSAKFEMGEEVFLMLTLMDSPTKYMVSGRVAWITPSGAQMSQAEGIGIHFDTDENSQKARAEITRILGAVLGAARPTHTM